jgi:hypothetical protein
MEDIVQIKENIKNYIKSAKKYNIPEENIGVDKLEVLVILIIVLLSRTWKQTRE